MVDLYVSIFDVAKDLASDDLLFLDIDFDDHIWYKNPSCPAMPLKTRSQTAKMKCIL